MLPAPWTLPWLPCYNCLYLDEPQDKVKPLCLGCFHQLCHQSQETVINTAGKLVEGKLCKEIEERFVCHYMILSTQVISI